MSTSIQAIGSAEKTAVIFDPLLKALFKIHDYKANHKAGSLISKRARNAISHYKSCTDDIKEEFRVAKIAKISSQSVTVVGGVLSFTPLAPLGWFMLGTGIAATATTDIVRSVDRRKENKWLKARDNLADAMLNPFDGTKFEKIYNAIHNSYEQIPHGVLASQDFATLLQCLGINYFIFREKGMNHGQAMEELMEVLNFFEQNNLMVSDDGHMIINGHDDKKPVDLTNLENFGGKLQAQKYSLKNVMQLTAVMATAGILAGVALGGLAISAQLATILPNLAHALYSLGSFSASAFEALARAGPALAIIGGIVGIIIDAMALANIDATFQPYYDYADKCDKLLKDRNEEAMQMDKHFAMLFEAMNTPRKVPPRKSKELVAIESQIHELKKEQRHAFVAKDFDKMAELQKQVCALLSLSH